MAMTLVSALVFAKTCFPLKNVTAGQSGILVNNFLEEIEIPYEQIASVYENKWLNTRDITIGLNVTSRFGQEIRFQPYSQFTFRFWRDHPAAVLLRELALSGKPTR